MFYQNALIPLMILGALISAAYGLFADAMEGGQSFGKRMLDLRVVDEATKAPCTLGQSFIRRILLGVLGFIDMLFIFGDKHQRLGDKAAGTIVVPA
jgi:uncharacterized RDD family membrane protein YckC